MEKVTIQTISIKEETTLSDEVLINGFVEDCRLRMMVPVTIKRYRSILETVSSFIREKGLSLAQLDKETLKAVLRYLTEERHLSHKTIGNYFSAISSFCDYLIFEELIDSNIVLPFRKRYLRQYKSTQGDPDPQRKLISVDDMRILISSILGPRDKAIVTLLAKTGIRRNELIMINLGDIDWIEQSIRLKPHPKRSNCVVFFDDECAVVLRRWVKARQNYKPRSDCNALFINERGGRLKRHGVYHTVTKHAERAGLHNPKSKRMEEHFTPHCCRHWFTTHLRRSGIRRELLQELRGDARNEAVDIYDHIDPKELKRAYLAAVPLLGIA